MHTVVETEAFLTSAKEEGVTEAQRADIVATIAANPAAGAIMAGTGGARKVRVAGRGKGKSGGYRVVTYYAEEGIPVYLLDIYSKDSQANLSQADRNELKTILTAIHHHWKQRLASRRSLK